MHIDLVSVTKADTIQLQCSNTELMKMEPFIPTCFIQEKVNKSTWNHGYGWENSNHWPYVVSAKRSGDSSEDDLSIPVKEVAVGRGNRVEAMNGFVGKVDEFVVSPENRNITHT